MFFHEIISQMVYRSLKIALLLKVCFKGESMKRVCSHKEISLLFLRKIFLSLLSVPLAWPHCFQPSQFQNPKLGMSKSQRRKGSDGSLKVPNTGQSCLSDDLSEEMHDNSAQFPYDNISIAMASTLIKYMD